MRYQDLPYHCTNGRIVIGAVSGPSLIASFVYDGDGARVKSTINNVATTFVGNYYEVSGGTVTKYYYVGADRVAMRTNGTLYYLLTDHLGSTSITTDANGNMIAEMKYKAWGEVRYTSGTTPTKYTYTGQYSHTSEFGLLFYQSRWMDPSLGRFTSADSIVPGGVQGLDRYAYVNNSPLNHTDPTGHRCEPGDYEPGGYCWSPPAPPPLLVFSNDENQSFTSEEIQVFQAGAWDVARALARERNVECHALQKMGEECSFVTPREAFFAAFGGSISVRRVTGTCECWAMHQGLIKGHYEIWVYRSTSTQEITTHPNLIVHEIGHAFYWAAGGFIEGSSVGDRSGFYGDYYLWQFGHDSEGDLGTEIFADMFLGWVYGKWEVSEERSGLSDDGRAKSEYMDKYMPLMIDKAITR